MQSVGEASEMKDAFFNIIFGLGVLGFAVVMLLIILAHAMRSDK
jgi:hypothetical protein